MQRGKKALSPVITTILLVMIAIILAIIILMWARGFIKEGVQKFDSPIEDICRQVAFNAQVAGSKEISVINSGDVPIHKFGVEISGVGSDIVYSNELNFVSGSSRAFTVNETVQGSKIKIIPVLLGQFSDGSLHEYSCRGQSQTLNP